MDAHADVYDLGEVTLEGKTRAIPAAAPRKAAWTGERVNRAGPGPGLAASLSLFIPGTGQMLTGERLAGLFFMTSLACTATVGRALFVTHDRVLPTLDLLEVPRLVLGLAFGILAILAASLHLASIVHAHESAPGAARDPAHPVVAGLASAILPGWGQILLGHRARAVAFLASLWIAGAAWLLASPEGVAALRGIGLEVPAEAKSMWGPVALITLPALTWTLAVYDAVAGAVSARR